MHTARKTDAVWVHCSAHSLLIYMRYVENAIGSLFNPMAVYGVHSTQNGGFQGGRRNKGSRPVSIL